MIQKLTVPQNRSVEIRFRRQSLERPRPGSLLISPVNRSELVDSEGKRLRFRSGSRPWILTNICFIRSYQQEETCELVLQGLPDWQLKLVFAPYKFPSIVGRGFSLHHWEGYE